MNPPAPTPSTDAPLWQAADAPGLAPAAALADWLLDEGSLTRRLTALAAGRFDIRALRQGLEPLRDDECAALGIAPGSEGWVREVFLRGNGEHWVFARSVAALAALDASGLEIRQLGERSLGELLFCDRAFRRGPLEICRYPADWLPAEVAQPGLWGRRSCFSREDARVLVAEVFLPALWRAAGLD